MLRGHTVIELTDVTSGKKRRYEDDNMVTNAVQTLLSYNGIFAPNNVANAMGNSVNGTMCRLTGGLLLFDKSIPEERDRLHAPAGTHIVGCASGEAYTGSNTMVGSYNREESGFQGDGSYKHVWDFATSQANGAIACACLTTRAGGKITDGTYPYASDYGTGIGDTSNDEMFYSGSIATNIDTCGVSESPKVSLLYVDGTNNRYLRWADYSERSAYYHHGISTSNYAAFQKTLFYKKTVDISRHRLGLTDFSIFDTVYEPGSAQHGRNYIDTVTVEMPEELKQLITQETLEKGNQYWGLETAADDENIYLVLRIPTNSNGASNYIKPGEKLHVWQINAATFESTYFEVNNTTGENVTFGTGTSNAGNTFCEIAICKDTVLLVGYDSKKIYAINKRNSSEVAVLKHPDGTEYVNKSQYMVFAVAAEGKIMMSADAYTGTPIAVYDTVSGQVRYKNTSWVQLGAKTSAGSNYSSGAIYKAVGTPYFCQVYSNRGSWDRIYPIFDPTYLVTINNLETLVTKTAAQTLKITYTLTAE